jgi:AbiV family abortive infection protein
MGKTFLNLSKAECKSISQEVLFNANRKWESAIVLSKSGDFGSASSLLITSTEELLKAFILDADSFGLNLRKVPSIQKMFKNDHQSRYDVFNLILILSYLIDSFIPYVKYLISLKIGYSGPKINFNLNYIETIQNEYSKKRLIAKSINHIRTDGLYVRYNDKVYKPSDIIEDDFKNLMDLFLPVQKFVNEIMTADDDNEEPNKMDLIVLELKKSNFHVKLEDIINIISGEKSLNPDNKTLF